MGNDPRWQKGEVQFNLPSPLTDILTGFKSLTENLKGFLEFIQTGGKIAKAFMSGVANPALFAIVFLLDQLLNFIGSVKNSGVHWFHMFPGIETNSGFVTFNELFPNYHDLIYKSTIDYEKSERLQAQLDRLMEELYTELHLPLVLNDGEEQPGTYSERDPRSKEKIENTRAKITAKQKEIKQWDIDKVEIEEKVLENLYEGGFHVLNGEDALTYYLDSLYDPGDGNRPLWIPRQIINEGTKDEIIVPGRMADENLETLGGFVMVFGASGNLLDILKSFTAVFQAIAFIFNINQPKYLYEDIMNILAREGGIDQGTELLGSTVPDWSTKKLFLGKDSFFPVVGDGLGTAETYIKGVKSKISNVTNAIGHMVDFLDAKISQIGLVVDEIDVILEWITEAENKIGNLANVKVSYLWVDPQKGGMSKLKRAIGNDTESDSSDPKHPANMNFQYCCLISAIGSGPGIGLIGSILGLTDDDPISFLGVQDDIIFEEDAYLKKYGLDDASLEELRAETES